MQLTNDCIALNFDENTGELTTAINRLTVETFRVRGDGFVIEMVDDTVRRGDCALESKKTSDGAWHVVYRRKDLRVEVTYRLHGNLHFMEKTIGFTCARAGGLRKVTVSAPVFESDARMNLHAYRYQKNVTFFGRTRKGGLFTGLELPYDASWSDGRTICLAFCPNLKLGAGETMRCEPMYLGVYAKPAYEGDAQFYTCDQDDGPLPSESDAMVAMASALLPKPREDLVTLPIIWNCMLAQQTKYTSQAEVDADQRVFDYVRECGFWWSHEFNTWGGEFARLNQLTGDAPLDYDPLQKELLEYGKRQGFKLVLWATMTNAHPWRGGTPFRPDRPDWLTTEVVYRPSNYTFNTAGAETKTWQHVRANCMGHRPYVEWLERIIRGRLESGLYDGFSLDGDFAGGPGWTGLRCPCHAENHDHLPGDANYACQRAVARMLERIRRDFPDCAIWLMRPMMDLGVWSARHGSCMFTIDEFSKIEGLPGLKDQPLNVLWGDKMRLWSRFRLHHHFLPHYLDQPLVFPYTGSKIPGAAPWSGKKLDYVLLSALSCSPHQSYYLPPADDMPAADRREFRKWLDWGRQHIRHLFVRKDLPGWPHIGHVDGSAHLIDGQGFLFLFNPNQATVKTSFSLTRECLGLTVPGRYRLSHHYPDDDAKRMADHGQTVEWEVPGESVIIIEIRKG